MTLHEIVARNMRSHWDYAPEPEAVMRCPECGQYQGEGDVLYFYTGTGECVGCWRDVEKHSAEGFDYKCGMCGEEAINSVKLQLRLLDNQVGREWGAAGKGDL